MPIVDLQRRMRELGRIRCGVQVAGKGGRMRPEKLKTFRITSDRRTLVEAAAAAFGGDVRPWDGPDGPEFEVITTAETLDIVVPPGESVTQWNELWGSGGCLRRCDGKVETISGSACLCPRDGATRAALSKKGEACKATTRLSVILPQIPDLGVWRLESHSWYAAIELAGAADVLRASSDAGVLIPARLRLDQRTKKVPGQPTNHYAVPVIEFHETRMADLIADGTVRVAGQLPAPKPVRPALPPGPALPPTSDLRGPALTDETEIEGHAVEVKPTCGWRLQRRDGSIDDCTAGELHPGHHSWHDIAIGEGGKVLHPAESVPA